MSAGAASVPLAVAVFAVTVQEVGWRMYDEEGPALPAARICAVDCTVTGTRRGSVVAERLRDAIVKARDVDGGDDAAGWRAPRLPWLPHPLSSVSVAAPTANAVISRLTPSDSWTCRSVGVEI
jgi:hypothetical protein